MRDDPGIRLENPHTAVLTGVSARDRARAQAALTYLAPGYARDWRYRRGLWDGKVCLLDGDRFPAGLAGRVAALLGVPAVGRWRFPQQTAVYHQWTWNDADPGPLRDYQTEAVTLAEDAWRGVLQLATGAGKTEIMARLVYQLRQPALILVHTKDLFRQTVDRLARRLPQTRLGLVGDGHHDFGEVTVALYQSLIGDLDALADTLTGIGVLIIDEAHHTSAASYQAVVAACPATHRYGFTATPDTEKTSDILLEATCGPVVYTYSNREGVEAGYLTPPHVLMRPYTSANLVDERCKDWHTIYRHGVLENTVRNQLVVDDACTAATDWGKTLLVVNHIEHGNRLAEGIVARQVPCSFVHSKLPARQRRAIIAGFKAAAGGVLLGTSLFDEGLDVPDISVVSLAAGGRADHKTLQRLGRGMRRAGAAHLVVLDYWDDAHPVLTYHAGKRLELYAREGWEVEAME